MDGPEDQQLESGRAAEAAADARSLSPVVCRGLYECEIAVTGTVLLAVGTLSNAGPESDLTKMAADNGWIVFR